MTQRFSFWEDLSIRENLEFVARLYEVPGGRARVGRGCSNNWGWDSARQDQLAEPVVRWLEAAHGAGRLHAPRSPTAFAGRADRGR